MTERRYIFDDLIEICLENEGIRKMTKNIIFLQFHHINSIEMTKNVSFEIFRFEVKAQRSNNHSGWIVIHNTKRKKPREIPLFLIKFERN